MTEIRTLLLILAGLALLGVSQASAGKVKMSGKDCRRLIQDRARADVNYKPGVDVRGRKVRSANVKSSHGIKLPRTIEFDIAFNPLKGTSASRFGETSASVGKVKYDMNKGTFTFNGQPIGDREQAKLARACRKTAR